MKPSPYTSKPGRQRLTEVRYRAKHFDPLHSSICIPIALEPTTLFLQYGTTDKTKKKTDDTKHKVYLSVLHVEDCNEK